MYSHGCEIFFVSTNESRRASKKGGETPGNREESPKKWENPNKKAKVHGDVS